MFFKRRRRLRENPQTKLEEQNQRKVYLENIGIEDNLLQNPLNAEIIDIILAFVLVSGEYSHDFIIRRLQDLFPLMKRENIDRYFKYCAELRDDIFKIIDQMYLSKVSENQVKSRILEKYSFINEENYKQLYSQGQFLSWMKHYGNLL